MIQFAYRAAAYQNLALLLGVFLVVTPPPNGNSEHLSGVLNHRAIRYIAACCILLSAYGVTIKWAHIKATRSNRGGESAFFLPSEAERQALIELPDRYYGILDYTTPDLFAVLPADEAKNAGPVTFRFNSTADFGAVQPLQISLAETSWVRTNIPGFRLESL